jgi:hypothetical protein
VKLKSDSVLGSIEYKPGKGVTICETCISTPGRLNETVIGYNLLELGWLLTDVELVQEVIRKRKLEEEQ